MDTHCNHIDAQISIGTLFGSKVVKLHQCQALVLATIKKQVCFVLKANTQEVQPPDSKAFLFIAKPITVKKRKLGYNGKQYLSCDFILGFVAAVECS